MENHLRFLEQPNGGIRIGTEYKRLSVVLIKCGADIHPQIAYVGSQRRVHKKCERGSVVDIGYIRRRARAEERSKSLFIQLGDYRLRLMLGNLKKHVLC